MDKRLISAVLLSLLVLYVWAGLTHKPSSVNTIKNTQHIENNTVRDTSSSDDLMVKDQEILDPSLQAPADNQEKEDLTSIETKHLLVTFSNLSGAIKEIYIKNYDERFPLTDLGSTSLGSGKTFTLDKLEDNLIIFRLVESNYTIENEFRVSKDGYDIEKQTRIISSSEMSNKIDVSMTMFVIDANRMDISDKNHDKSLYEYAISSYDGMHRKNNAFKFNHKETRESNSHVLWAGYRNRYFCVLNKPMFDTNGYKIEVLDDLSLNIMLKKSIELGAGESIELSSLIFAGPEIHEILSSYKLDLEKIKKFYRFGLFDIIAMAIYRLMNFIHSVIPNWGVSIVLISIIIYFSMYPLTLRGMSSMKKMQALQPEIAKIKEKYSSNPQKMNQEMMLLYKEHKINPIGGCLPFLLQMPIFIGLYQVLWRSVSFKGADFLWIKDLSEPDKIYILPFKLPFMGDEVNLLPILMMIIMFIQQQITSKSMVMVDPIQKQQQKMMGIIMPIFLGVIFYKFASGLTLYFTLFYVFSTFTQFYMYKQKAK